ncbi:TIGR03084 family metal-binding protein [Nocardioides campestrisoli]|uniref:TIGR03084 family metal-binding protein n=1 Tax=Nocardioides campestrisoli TaxID=2736757 RepID=UPI0015E77B1D|nr:TIGR03084 family metal-binding protein [Nocardioides campestrisoli]
MLDDVLADLTAEGDRLEALVAPLAPEQWRTPTPAAGWDVATQVAHLAWTDEVAVKAATDKEAWDAEVMGAIGNPEGYVDEMALQGGAVDPAELLARWRTARAALVQTLRDFPEGQKLPWFGPPMSPTSMATARLMETWAHSLDVHEALGAEPEQSDRIRHVAHLAVRTRNYSFAQNGLEKPAEEFRIELTSPSGETWTYGPEDAAQTVTGPAYDLCLLATQRIHRADTALVATGADADQWLDIAQCFAGPAGEGRAAR